MTGQPLDRCSTVAATSLICVFADSHKQEKPISPTSCNAFLDQCDLPLDRITKPIACARTAQACTPGGACLEAPMGAYANPPVYTRKSTLSHILKASRMFPWLPAAPYSHTLPWLPRSPKKSPTGPPAHREPLPGFQSRILIPRRTMSPLGAHSSQSCGYGAIPLVP